MLRLCRHEESSLAIPFAAFERVRQWRMNEESKTMEARDTLMPRIKETEVYL